MKYHPIKIQFILPAKSSIWAKRSYRHLQHLIRTKGTVNLELKKCNQSKDSFTARIVFRDESPTTEEAELPSKRIDFSDSELCSIEELTMAAQAILDNSVYLTLKPNQRLYALMTQLTKPVRVNLLCQICDQILELRSATIRGTLNKNRSLYVSPKHGIWCTAQLAEKQGWQEYRRQDT